MFFKIQVVLKVILSFVVCGGGDLIQGFMYVRIEFYYRVTFSVMFFLMFYQVVFKGRSFFKFKEFFYQGVCNLGLVF